MKHIHVFSLALTLGIAAAAQAQTEWAIHFDDKDKPMALDQPSAPSANQENQDAKGFWIFPEPCAMTGGIFTDRPGYSDTAMLVPRGHFQIESGYTFSYDREHHRRTIDHTMPEIALRTGLLDCLEFRTKWNGYSYTEVLDKVKTPAGRHVSDTDHVDGGTDLNLGFKIRLLKQECWRPNLSIIPSLYVPTGSASKSANNVVPEIKFPWNYGITEKFAIYGSLLGRVPDGPDGQFFQTAATLAAGYKVHECVALYIEYYGLYPSIRSQDCAHLLSAGPIVQITENLSVDARVGVGLNEQAPDFQAAVGFGVRF